MGGLYAVVLARYRSMIPLMYVLLLIEYAGRLAIGAVKPVITLATLPGEPGSLVVIVIAVTCLFLSLRGIADSGQRDAD